MEVPGPYRIEIDKQSCQSSGRCVERLPEAFGWDDDDLGDVLPAASVAAAEALLEVARACPALAIGVFDADGDELSVEG